MAFSMDIRCYFLVAIQESNQRKWHRGGADREAYRSCVYNLSKFPRLRAALPYVPLPALVGRLYLIVIYCNRQPQYNKNTIG